MNMEKTLYYNGQVIDNKYKNNIVDNILKLSLKKGDSFELFPFNHFDDEKTDYKEEKMEFHTNLKIVDIKFTMVQSWNSTIKNKVEVFLENLT
jgi:hypothetical protein